MSDLRKLYSAAKAGNPTDISSYVEAVQTIVNDPRDYILNLEYIISSDIGLKTLKPFIEKHGLPIAAYPRTVELLENCVEKLEKSGKDASLYKESIKDMESFKEKYQGAFDMFDFYIESNEIDSYISTYYGSTNVKPNNILPKGLFERFGFASIPDFIIKSDSSDKIAGAYNKYLESVIDYDDHMLCEFLHYACEGTKVQPDIDDCTLSCIVESCKKRNQKVYRESVIMNDQDACYSYTESEIEAINDLIKFKEFVVTGMDASKSESIMEAQCEILSLYDEMDGVIFEEDDNIYEKKDEGDLVPIYILLGKYDENRTNKNFKDAKKSITTMTKGDNYTHAVISLDDTFKNMYSFEAKGIAKDDIDKNIWMGTESIYVGTVFVTKSEFNKIKKLCEDLANDKEKTSYAYSNLIRAYVGKPIKQDKRFVCSTFVAYLLYQANPKNLHRDYSRLRPEDMTIIPRGFYVMNAKNRMDLMKKQEEMKTKVKEIYSNHKEELDDYNNHLPKLLLQDKMKELKTFDKILDYFMSKGK